MSRISRVYAVLSAISHLIIRADEQQPLFEDTCRILVDEGLFKMAWIGLVEEASRTIKPAAFRGAEGGYLKDINISIDEIPEGEGPTGTAFRTASHFINNDTAHNPRMLPWRDEALKRGYLSNAAFPLICCGKPVGVLTVYASEKGFFDEDEVRLLDELAADISYAMVGMAERKKAEQQKADFYAMITHDLKSPLTSILGYAELIRMKPDEASGEVLEMVEGIENSGKKIIEMIDSFLAASKIESGAVKLKKAPADVRKVVERIVKEFESQAIKKGLELKLEAETGLPEIAVDSGYIGIAVENLVQNAVNYTPDGGRVTVGAKKTTDGAFIVVFVSDTGPGIPHQHHDRIFNRYYRVPGTRIKGTGIGLYTVKTIAEAHGGKIELESAPGYGSRFLLYLPVQ